MSSSSTADECPQINQRSLLDDRSSLLMAASSSSTNEVVTTDHNQSSQDPLKCPRCDSSNTKFCYYNNYSLSQPRHFCKACKRYWTRGGTLRNVPVGGGCRRHKRSVVKRQPPSSSAATVKPTADPPPQNPSHAYNDNPLLFYSQLPTNNPDNLDDEVSFPFSRFSSTTRVSTSDDFRQHQMNGFGLGFPSGFQNSTDNYENRPIFLGSASSSLAPTSTKASFLDSKLQNQRFGVGGYEDIQMPTENGSGRNNPNQIHDDEQIIINDSSHFSSLLWSANNNAAAADNNWFDP